MKKIINLLLMTLLAAGSTSCWNEDIPEAGDARHQVENLKATPGDEEVLLSWSMPEGWKPSDFIVFYTNAKSESVTLRTGGEMQCTVDKLSNGTQYTFNVQAVYGKLISNPLSIVGKPATERFPVTDLAVESGDQYATLRWSKPSMQVLSYSLSFYNEDNPDEVKQQSIDKDATSITLEELTNDKNYYFSLVAEYAKGPSEAATVKAMPTMAIPFTLDRETAAKNQPITFTFNTEGYPTATDVKWTFPGSVVREGTVVKQGLSSVGTQTVVLSATINGKVKSWNVEVVIREYVVYSTDWTMDGTNYNGFKGSAPAFSPDGRTVYVVAFNRIASLHAFDLITGSEKWRYVPAVNASSYNMLAVNPVTGDIYYGTTSVGQFYAVTAEGRLKWTFTETQSMQSASPAVNAAGTEVYVCDRTGNVFAIDAASGTKKWKFATGSYGGGLLVNGNDLIVGTQGGIHFLNIADGTEIVKLSPRTGMTEITGFAVSNDKKTAYFPNKGGAMSALDLTSRTLKVNCYQVATADLYEPVVAPNGTVFVGGKDSKVYNLDAALTKVNWSYLHDVPGTTKGSAFNYSHPCVDNQNRFYITSGTAFNTSYIFDANGNVVESWSYDSSDTNQKQMSGNNYLDGVFYSALIGSNTKNGIFVGRYVGGENASSWSRHGGDPCGTCCIK